MTTRARSRVQLEHPPVPVDTVPDDEAWVVAPAVDRRTGERVLKSSTGEPLIIAEPVGHLGAARRAAVQHVLRRHVCEARERLQNAVFQPPVEPQPSDV